MPDHFNNEPQMTFSPLKTLHRLMHSKNGATAIEYGIIAGGISVAIIGAISLIAPRLHYTFIYTAKTLASAG